MKSISEVGLCVASHVVYIVSYALHTLAPILAHILAPCITYTSLCVLYDIYYVPSCITYTHVLRLKYTSVLYRCLLSLMRRCKVVWNLMSYVYKGEVCGGGYGQADVF